MSPWLRALLGTLIVLAVAQAAGVTERVNRSVTDLHWRMRATREKKLFPQDIVIVAIDDKTIGELGRLRYWSRKRYAQLIDHLRQARAVGIDILFDDLDVVDRAGDEALAAAIRRHGKVVVPFHAWYDIPPLTNESQRQIKALADRMPNAGAPFTLDAPEQKSFLLQPPIPLLLAAAPELGTADVGADSDGVYRAPVLLKRTETGKVIPHFALAVATVAEGQPVKTTLEEPTLRLGDRKVNLISGELWLQPWARRAGGSSSSRPGAPVRTISMVDALKESPDTFKEAIVLIGETATGTTDIRASILDPGLRGVELNAEIVANILYAESVTESPAWLFWLLLFVAIGVPVALYERVGSGWAAAWSAAALCIPVGLMELGFWLANQVPSWTPIVLGSVSATGMMIAQRVAQEEAQKRNLRVKFSQYVAPELVEQVIVDPDRVVEKGARMRVVVLFSDVRSFTSYSEQNPPELVVKQMSEYLTEMTDSVHAHGGVLDKFIGDAVMALFGPIFIKDEINWSARAVACAVDMLGRLEKLNQDWSARGMPLFRIGIGLHVGDAVVGSIGSPSRLQFTALGDTVNLSARLQSETKALKAVLVMSEDVKAEAEALLKDHVRFKDRGNLSVRGREQPVRVYEVPEETAPKETPEVKESPDETG